MMGEGGGMKSFSLQDLSWIRARLDIYTAGVTKTVPSVYTLISQHYLAGKLFLGNIPYLVGRGGLIYVFLYTADFI